jgi:hypothetical protein
MSLFLLRKRQNQDLDFIYMINKFESIKLCLKVLKEKVHKVYESKF